MIASLALAWAGPHHDLAVEVEPSTGRLAVVDRVSGLEPGRPIAFTLHAGLAPVVRAKGWTLHALGAGEGPVPVERFELRTKKKRPKEPVELRYAGVIAHPLDVQGEEYQRSFSETPGLISDEGVYLAGSSAWVPRFDDGPITYAVSARFPEGWSAVGSGDPRPCEGCTAFVSAGAMDEIHLVAARFQHTRDAVNTARGTTGIDVYLREPDPGLAFRYAQATGRYLQLYESMLPPYPFERFALVENFWETGYGMPAFTLLGPQVIRFPWVLTSSYPHEILHTWWGNSVSIDPAGGNWAEGLTAYMADHLFAEHRGQDAQYRRATLQKYTDLASDADFPLVEFLGRTSASTEAVGYGKSLMFWHMLRRRIGDEAFLAGLSAFFEARRFTRAGFANLEPHLTAASGEDLGPWFDAWTRETGALRLSVADVRVEDAPGGAVVRGRLVPGAALPAQVPLFVTTAGSPDALAFVVDVAGGVPTSFELPIPASAGAPLRVDIDPLADVMRALDPREVAPVLSTLFGEQEKVYVLPASASEAERAAWTELATAWAKPAAPTLRLDRDVDALPPGAIALGAGNVHGPSVVARAAHAGATLGKGGLSVGGETHGPSRSLVVVARSDDPARAVGWVTAGPVAAIPGLARKLPHYTKYSFLAFDGDAPDNVAKATWEPESSPLAIALGPTLPAMGKLKPRPALAEMPPRFDAGALQAHATWLADPAREGREPGSGGMADAVAYVAAELAKTGLTPEIQTFTEKVKDREISLSNVVLRLDGARDQPGVVVFAHLDHLGRGWPESRSGAEGQVHPGADDNASGVAVALEVARSLAAEPARPRPVTFVFTDGEEAGLIGARRWIADAPVPFACVSLDTVGRMKDGRILVAAAETAREWRFLFMGVGYGTGASFDFAAPGSAASDHAVCIAKGVPAVQLTTGPNADYHSPTDTADKLDADGMVKVADVAREAVAYLAERAEPLTAQIGPPQAASGQARSASLGTMPDFAFGGPGVRVADVMPGSAAQSAKLQAGDVLLAVGGAPIADLKSYSELLKKHAPGDRVEVRFRRGETESTVTVVLQAR